MSSRLGDSYVVGIVVLLMIVSSEIRTRNDGDAIRKVDSRPWAVKGMVEVESVQKDALDTGGTKQIRRPVSGEDILWERRRVRR